MSDSHQTSRPRRSRASADSHRDVHAEALAVRETHAAPHQPATAAQALAFCNALGIDGDEIAQFLASQKVSAAQLAQLAKVNLHNIADAYPPEVTTALEHFGASIKITAATPAVIRETAARVTQAADLATKLQAGAARINAAARADADVLDAVTRQATPQIEARAAVDANEMRALAPISAYHHDRYPGSHAPAAKAPTPKGT